MNGIQKISDLKPAVIQADGRRPTASHELLIKFLIKCSNEHKIIDRDSILELYMYTRFGKAKLISIQHTPMYSRFRDDPDKMITRDQFKREYRVPSLAMSWFKSALGACIIKGRIIALPVINIEDPEEIMP